MKTVFTFALGFVIGYLIVDFFNSNESKSVDELRAIYYDSISTYKDSLGREVYRKQIAELNYEQLKQIDSVKYQELVDAFGKQIKNIMASTEIKVVHDTVYSKSVVDTLTGDWTYKDSCLYAEGNTLVGMSKYLIAPLTIDNMIRKDSNKMFSDVIVKSPCGKVEQIKTFTFFTTPTQTKKEWYEKPLVIGGIGLTTGFVGALLLVR